MSSPEPTGIAGGRYADVPASNPEGAPRAVFPSGLDGRNGETEASGSAIDDRALGPASARRPSFARRAATRYPPPIVCNLSLTNKCNLRCEICGSQKHLDATGILRRHMDIGRFEAVAETLFPVIAEVELNSQGDPLLYPHIERVLEVIAAYRCELKVQTNGTLFTDQSNRSADAASRNRQSFVGCRRAAL